MEDCYSQDMSNVISETIDGEVIVMNIKDGRYYALNESASFIWGLLMKGHGVGSILSGLGNRFMVEASTLHQHMQDFIGKLLHEGILRPQHGLSFEGGPDMSSGLSSYKLPEFKSFEPLSLIASTVPNL